MLSREFLIPTQLAKPKSAHSIQAGQGKATQVMDRLGRVGSRGHVRLVGLGEGGNLEYMSEEWEKLGRGSRGCRSVGLGIGRS